MKGYTTVLGVAARDVSAGEIITFSDLETRDTYLINTSHIELENTMARSIAGINFDPATRVIQAPWPDDGYEQAMSIVAESVNKARGPFFRVVPEGGGDLADLYLSLIPPARRQHYNCRACLDFIRTYGPVVYLTDDGRQHSLLFRDYRKMQGTIFHDVFRSLERRVKRGRVSTLWVPTRQSRGNARTLGTPHSDGWSHFHGKLNDKVLLTREAEAAKLEGDFFDVYTRFTWFVNTYSLTELNRALALAAHVSRPTKVTPQLQTLLNLKQQLGSGSSTKMRSNIVAKFAATYPLASGRSTVAAALLAGMKRPDPTSVIPEINRMLDPMSYQRPTTVKQGTIDQAEKLFREMGLESALRRRYATVNDVGVDKAWQAGRGTTVSRGADVGSIFGSIVPTKPRPKAEVIVGGGRVTMRTFMEEVVPLAQHIEVYLPSQMVCFAFVTAQSLEAPRIIKWDKEDTRCPVTWFVHQQLTRPEQWGWSRGWRSVEAVVRFPDGSGVTLVPRNASPRLTGAVFFPEFLRPDLHKVRSVLEAHSRQATDIPRGGHGHILAGPTMTSTGGPELTVKVQLPGGVVKTMVIDRWK